MLIVRVLQWFVHLLSWLYFERNKRLQRDALFVFDVRVLQWFVHLLPWLHVQHDRILQRDSLYLPDLR